MKLFIGTGSAFLELLQVGAAISTEDFIALNQNKIQFFNVYHLYEIDHPIYFIIYNEFEVIGVLKTQVSMMATDKYPFKGINYCSVKESFQGNSIATQLYSAMFQYYNNDYVVGTHYDSEDSELKLKKMSIRLAKENNVYYMTRIQISSYESYDDFPDKDDLYS